MGLAQKRQVPHSSMINIMKGLITATFVGLIAANQIQVPSHNAEIGNLYRRQFGSLVQTGKQVGKQVDNAIVGVGKNGNEFVSSVGSNVDEFGKKIDDFAETFPSGNGPFKDGPPTSRPPPAAPDTPPGSAKPDPPPGSAKPDTAAGSAKPDAAGVRTPKPKDLPEGFDSSAPRPQPRSRVQEVAQNPSKLVDAPEALTWIQKVKKFSKKAFVVAQVGGTFLGIAVGSWSIYNLVQKNGEKVKVEVDAATGLPLTQKNELSESVSGGTESSVDNSTDYYGYGYEDTSQFYYYGRPYGITDPDTGRQYVLDTDTGYYYFINDAGESEWYLG